MEPIETAAARPPFSGGQRLPLLVIGVAALVVGVWLLSTPPGLLGKADAVGYAVCHRIDLRSFHLGERQLPLCARCTGTFLGALLGLIVFVAAGRGRAGYLPPWRVLAGLALGVAAFGLDGLNSFAALFPGLPHLYEPQNWLRLTTGTFTGLCLAALTYPVFSQTLWTRWEPRPPLASLRELGGLALLGLGVIGLVLTENPAVLYPLALLSAVGVLALLTLLTTTVLLILARRENRAQGWRQAWLPLLAGFTLAMLEIGAADALRYAVFGSWAGFKLLG